MKQTFLPIFILLSVILLLLAFLYFTDKCGPDCPTHTHANQVKVGVIDSSLHLTDTAALDNSQM